MNTAEIAAEYRQHCLNLPKGKPGTIGASLDRAIAFDLDHLCLWLARVVTKENHWWSKDNQPEFIRVSKRVLSWYRRHGWIRGAGRYNYEWTEKAP